MYLSFPGGSDGKESAFNVGVFCLIPGCEDPLEEAWQPHPVFLFGKIPWTEEPCGLQSKVQWVAKSPTQLSTHTVMFHSLFILLNYSLQLQVLQKS